VTSRVPSAAAATAALLCAGLLVAAALTEAQRPFATSATLVADVSVGALLLLSAAMSPVTPTQRLLVGAVGASWAAASLVPVPALHRGALLLALLAFPWGRLLSGGQRVVALAAVPVAAGVLAAPAVVGVFLAVAVVCLPTGSPRDGARWFATSAALLMAGALSVSWALARWRPDAFDPATALLAYQICLVFVAVGHAVAARRLATARPRRVVDALAQMASATRTRIDALTVALADAVGDPDLRLHVAGAGFSAGPDRLVVEDRGKVLAVVESAGVAGADTATQDAVRTVVRLGVRGALLQEAQEQLLAELRAARTRLVDVADRQRADLARRLREDVLVEIDRASAALAALEDPTSGEPASGALAVVRNELRGAVDDMLALVAGVPPVDLGGGRLCTALQLLAGRTLLPVDVTCGEDVAGDAAAETALFYVCSEALANVVKHSAATRAQVVLVRAGGRLELTVVDDGRGGADSTGSGLAGLADRLTARGGELTVRSGPGGTTVVSAVPLNRSSARAR
jgi:signal transduction histidine kinase